MFPCPCEVTCRWRRRLPRPLPHQRRKLYIETVGCQMNMLDSELVVGRLRQEGYELTGDIHQADAILFNTCSVRQHAEDKIYTALGRLKRLKETRPDVSIGVLGCMAQKDQAQILKRAPHVDVVVGPGQLARVPELLEQARVDRTPQMAVSLPRNGGTKLHVVDSFETYDPLASRRCARARSRRSCGSRWDATSSARTASCRRSGGRSKADRRNRSLTRPGNWPTRASGRSPCSARRSTATRTRPPTVARPASPTCCTSFTTSTGWYGSSSSRTFPTT